MTYAYTHERHSHFVPDNQSAGLRGQFWFSMGFGVILAGIGVVCGYQLATAQNRVLINDLANQLNSFRAQLRTVETAAKSNNSQTMAQIDQLSKQLIQTKTSASDSLFAMRSSIKDQQRILEGQMQGIAKDEAECLAELSPFLDRKLCIPAGEVKTVLERQFSERLQGLEKMQETLAELTSEHNQMLASINASATIPMQKIGGGPLDQRELTQAVQGESDEMGARISIQGVRDFLASKGGEGTRATRFFAPPKAATPVIFSGRAAAINLAKNRERMQHAETEDDTTRR